MTVRERLTEIFHAAAAYSDSLDGESIFGDGCVGRLGRPHATLFLAAAIAARDEKREESKVWFTNYALSLLAHLARIAEESNGLWDDESAFCLAYGVKALEEEIPAADVTELSRYFGELTVEKPFRLSFAGDPGAALERTLYLAPKAMLYELAGQARPSLASVGKQLLDTMLPDGRSSLCPDASPLCWLALMLLLSRESAPFKAYAAHFAAAIPLPDSTLPPSTYEYRLSMLALLLSLTPEAETNAPAPVLPVSEEYGEAEAAFVRGKQRVATVCGLRHATAVLPSDASDFITAAALPALSVCGTTRYVNCGFSLTPYKGGFLTYTKETADPFLDSHEPHAVTLYRATAVLPDDETVLYLSFGRCEASTRLSVLEDQLWQLSPDPSRIYYYADAKRSLGVRADPKTEVGCYFNVSDRIGVVSHTPMTAVSEKDGSRRLLLARAEGPVRIGKGDTLFQSAAAIAVGGIRRTRALADTFLTLDGLPRGILSVSAIAANRKRYTLLYNVTDAPFVWEDHTVAPETAVLLAWDR